MNKEATTQDDLKIGNAIIAEANKVGQCNSEKGHAAGCCRADDVGTRAEENNRYHKAFGEHR